MRPLHFCWVLGFLSLCLACNQPVENQFVEFVLNDSTRAVFPIQRELDSWQIQNGAEVLVLERVNDTVYRVPVFGGSLATGEAQLNQGVWTDSLRPKKNGYPYQVPFEITTRTTRSESAAIEGTWDVWFGEGDENDVATSQLDLTSTEAGVQGTIRTPTGDYRYLSGTFLGGVLTMQTFDGAHLYCITGVWEDGNWTLGSFYSGNHYRVSWQGKKADPWSKKDSIRMLSVPLDSLFVRVVDPGGAPVEIPLVPDGEMPLVVDILGSWCPNCMDEVRLLKEIVQPNGNQMLSVAFERPDSPLNAYERIQSFQSEMQMDWVIYLGGKANKQVAADAFPFLDQVISFPTTLFVHRDGTVYVHSGFNGPATGALYEQEVAVFKRYLAPLTSLENH